MKDNSTKTCAANATGGLKRAVLLLSVLFFAFGTLRAERGDEITVYIFMSETCPICQSVTLELKALYATYHPKGVTFVGLFPNQSMSTAPNYR